MKYFIDTEFLEGPQRKRLFGIPVVGLRWDKNECLEIYKPYSLPTIDLISIGIVAEDGREYYAISKDFNLKEAWNRFDLKETEYAVGFGFNTEKEIEKVYWLRENVLKPIWRELIVLETDYLVKQKRMIGYAKDLNMNFDFKNFKYLVNKYGKTNKEIAIEIQEFVYGFAIKGYDSETQKLSTKRLKESFAETQKPEFYAYYADYDWVVFCWLFGKMIDLPKGFPMYCKDLKQMMDSYVSKTWKDVELSTWGHDGITLEKLKNHSDYPKQDSLKSHNAIEDARWNKQLFEFLTKL
nr:3'-5' exoribonuclease [uncultured Flavobacterium sp.]